MPRSKTIAELRRQLAAQEGRLGKLQARRQGLSRQLERVDREIASLGGDVGAAKPRAARKVAKKAVTRGRKKVAKEAERAVGRAVAKPLSMFLAEALGKAREGQRAKDLAAAVLKAGYVTKDKNFKQTVASLLGTDKRFTRVSRGIYKLAGK